ncbi:MAG TPA: depupylase/deamidase Dop, partial [Dermatophilaceae bacterium]|nr:depupylase/deamidase Dop [Dermatophilaceae bacterium]
MTVRRVMGIETEYGISAPGDPSANPMFLSGHVVTAYARAHGLLPGKGGWDYSTEAPLRDARGWELGRAYADPSQLTDIDDPTLANVVLTNGARFYVDHAHPEYSGPEVTSPLDAVLWDRAGDEVMRRAATLLNPDPVRPTVALYKNNTDGKGASYGTHENYLMRRETAFGDIVRHLTPFFVARQIICGAGRVGIGQDSRTSGFQISQRADFFEAEVGLETTVKRPIINTRDEPHATPDRYRRLHVIIGDANQCDVATYLKMGTTSLVLGLIEAGVAPRGLELQDPVGSLKVMSRDPTLQALVPLRDGRQMRGLDLLWAYHDAAAHWLEDRGEMDPETDAVMTRWASVLTRLAADPMTLAGEIDWVAKLRVLQALRQRDGLAWTEPRLAALDIQWTDLRPEKSIFASIRSKGHVEQLATADQVLAAVTTPPEDTRAWFRGECLRRFAGSVVSASWDSIVFDVPGQQSLQRIPLNEPLKGTKAQVGWLLERSRDVGELLRDLVGVSD